MRVIDSLFDADDTVILQRLGDPNQAIYDLAVKKDMLWAPATPVLPFSDSFRYGESIAKVLDTVRVDRTLALGHNPDKPSLPPHLLLFACGNEQDVLPAFGALIRKEGLNKLDNSVFKAIGWVGKDKTDEGKACICSYNSEYRNTLSNIPRYFATLLSYSQAMNRLISDNPDNGRVLFDMVIRGLLHALRLADITHPITTQPFTARTLKSHLHQTDEKLLTVLHRSIAEWCLAFRQREMSAEQLRDAISEFTRTHFVGSEVGELTDFFDSNSVDCEFPPNGCANTFVSDAGDLIEIGTVHSVKGETHTATLFLETFNYDLDSKRLLPFCLGKYPAADARKARHRSNLKVAHVAFSRPTHLLAFACCNEHVAGHEKDFQEAGWVVHKI